MIDQLYLDNFTCFDRCTFDFCKGVNVLQKKHCIKTQFQ